MMDVNYFESMNDLSILAEERYGRNRAFSHDIVLIVIVSLFKVVNVWSGCPISRARGSWQKRTTIYNTINKKRQFFMRLSGF